MRRGWNPNKDKPLSRSKFWHQIIVPVYIPNQENYFKDALLILTKCLKSIFATTHSGSFITVVDNGSCLEVREYLESLQRKGRIHELVTTSNIGKLNAIHKGLVGHNFPIVTIADADTLFLSGWQEETVKIFETFPKAGTVGIVPQFNMISNFCTNVLFDNFFNPEMRFYKVGQPEEMRKFYQSLGWKMKPEHYYLHSILGIKKDGLKACVGSSHFVASYRREVLKDLSAYIPSKMGDFSEKGLDVAAMNAGRWKLTTFNNYAYHMGNEFETWMNNVHFNSEVPVSLKVVEKSQHVPPPGKLSFFLKNKLFKGILRFHLFNRFFFRYKELPNSVLEKYPRICY